MGKKSRKKQSKKQEENYFSSNDQGLRIFQNPIAIKFENGDKIVEASPEEVSERIGRPFNDSILIPKKFTEIDTRFSEGIDKNIIKNMLTNREDLVVFSMKEAGYGIRIDRDIQKGEYLFIYSGILEHQPSHEYSKRTAVALINKEPATTVNNNAVQINASGIAKTIWSLNAAKNCGYGALAPFLFSQEILDYYLVIDEAYKNQVACENLDNRSSMFIHGVNVTFFSAKEDLKKNDVIGWNYGLGYLHMLMYRHNQMERPPLMLFNKQGMPIPFNKYIFNSIWVINSFNNTHSSSTINYYAVLKSIKAQKPLLVTFQKSKQEIEEVLIPAETLEKLFVKHISSDEQLALLIEMWTKAQKKRAIMREEVIQITSAISKESSLESRQKLATAKELYLKELYLIDSSIPSNDTKMRGLIGIANWLFKRGLHLQKKTYPELQEEIFPKNSNPQVWTLFAKPKPQNDTPKENETFMSISIKKE